MWLSTVERCRVDLQAFACVIWCVNAVSNEQTLSLPEGNAANHVLQGMLYKLAIAQGIVSKHGVLHHS